MRRSLLLRLVIYFLLALALRLILFGEFPALLTGDSSGYLVTAYHIEQDGDFTDTSQQAVMGPGYPAFLAFTAPLTGWNSARIVLLQKALGMVGLLVGFGIGYLLRSPLAGEGLALFLGFNPVFLLYEHALSTEALFIFLLLLLTFIWLIWLRDGQRILSGALVGLLLSLTILTRPNGIPFGATLVTAGLLWLLWKNRNSGWRRLIRAFAPTVAAVAVGLGLFLAPWLLLNYTVHQRLALTNFNNRNLLIYKALHDPLDESLPEIGAMNDALDTPFGAKWLYLLKTNYPAREAERIARALYLEQLKADPPQHLSQIGHSFQNFFGNYYRMGNELASVFSWFMHLVPDPERVHQLAGALMFQEHPEFHYVSAGAASMTLRLWSQSGIFFLTALRPVLALLAAGAVLVTLWSHRRQATASSQAVAPLVIIFLGYLATAGAHIFTLTTNDRYATPFDWILLLLLLSSLQLVLSSYSTSRASSAGRKTAS